MEKENKKKRRKNGHSSSIKKNQDRIGFGKKDVISECLILTSIATWRPV